MHIPDGFLTPKVWLPLEVGGVLTIFYSSYKLKKGDPLDNSIMLGALGGFIFAAQMINIPIPGGTSGHLLGTMLLALAVGPWGALLVMGAILLIQALLFQDGGITAWGANLFNMGIVNLVASYGFYKLSKEIVRTQSVEYLLIGISGWLGVVFASLTTSIELWLSNLGSFRLILGAMLSWHILIGIIEGVGTVLVWKFIKRSVKELRGELEIVNEVIT